MKLSLRGTFLIALLLVASAFGQENVAKNEKLKRDSTGIDSQSVSSLRSFEAEALREELENLRSQVEGMNESYLETKGTVDALKKIKVSGYLQTQFQTAETAGQNPFAGGNFPANVKQRFSVRRGRLKANYDNDITQFVIQTDITQAGVVVKDAYAQFTEPWLKTFALTGGIFNRPFGFEIEYSSSNRESPERSRLFQTLFPGERDLGAKLTITPQSKELSFLKLDLGLLNGTGPTANDFDSHKDFIGHLTMQFPLPQHGFALDIGGSTYLGGVREAGSVVYKNVGVLPNGAKGFLKDSSTANIGAAADRNYFGVDAQLYYDLPILGGLTLRGEYITGKQTGTFSSTTSPTAQPSEIVMRNFNGAYFYYIQNIGLSQQFVLKYDFYDPNTDADVTNIGAPGSNFSTGDIKFSTLGIGWVYHWDANIKLIAYYDIVKNEKIHPLASGNLVPFRSDLKDNVLTLRVQYKF